MTDKCQHDWEILDEEEDFRNSVCIHCGAYKQEYPQSTMFDGRVMEVVYKLPWGHHGEWRVVFYDESWLNFTYDGAGDDPIWCRVECPD